MKITKVWYNNRISIKKIEKCEAYQEALVNYNCNINWGHHINISAFRVSTTSENLTKKKYSKMAKCLTAFFFLYAWGINSRNELGLIRKINDGTK